MKFNLAKRITLGYMFIIVIALGATVYSVLTLQRNNGLEQKIKIIYLPLYSYLKDLQAINDENIEITKLALDFRNRNQIESSLREIHRKYYVVKNSIVAIVSPDTNNMQDSIKHLLSEYDKVVYTQTKAIEDIEQLRAGQLYVQASNGLMKSSSRLLDILGAWKLKIDSFQDQKAQSDTFLSIMLITMIVSFFIAVSVVYLYTSKTIVDPIVRIKDLIVTLSEGKAVEISVNGRTDEIGKMMYAVKNLTTSMRSKSEFAVQVGKGNYDHQFELLSNDDLMGRALLSMRDNLKYSKAEERKRMEENRRLAMVVNKTTNIVVLADSNGRIEWVNPAFTRVTGFQQGEVIDQELSFLVRGRKVDEDLLQFAMNMISAQQGFKGLEFLNYTKGDIPYWVALEVQAIVGKLGTIEQYIVIGTDITERKASQRDMEERNNLLEKINSELDRFVYSASHDLRAPIASLLGLIEVARLEKDYVKKDELLGKQKLTLLRLDKFIKDIIDYSRNSRLEVEAEPVDFERMVNATMDQLQFMENYSKIEKIVYVNQESKFYSSPTRISVILNNLIANGIKYSNIKKGNPYLKIIVNAEERHTEIRVIDNGEGVPEDAQEKIFNMFYRASERSSGSGLGLYIVKETIHKLGGTIQVRSEYGKGTEFRVSIPAKDKWN